MALLSPIVSEDVEDVCERTRVALTAMRGKTIVIAGAAGFLPSFLTDVLARSNDTLDGEPLRILCIDNFTTGMAHRLAHLEGRDDVETVAASVVEPFAPSGRVDYVVHGASIASPTWYRRFPLETIDVNTVGTKLLLELSREHDVAGFVYLSSSEIYGDPPPDRVPTIEEYWGNVSSTGPRAPYDESKRLAETLCTTYHRLYGTPVRIIRPFNVYGPRLRLDDGRVIPDFLGDVLAGRSIKILSDGRATRSFCYVTDFVAALVLLLVGGSDGEAYNVGNDEERSIAYVAELVARLTDPPVAVEFARSDDALYLVDNPSRRCPDLTKTRAAIPWAPSMPLAEGLKRTFRYYAEGGTA